MHTHTRWGRLRATMMPWPGLVEPFTECLGLGVLGALCLHRLLHLNPLVFLLVHTLVWFLFDLLLMKLIEVRVWGRKRFLVLCVKKVRQGWDSNPRVQSTMD